MCIQLIVHIKNVTSYSTHEKIEILVLQERILYWVRWYPISNVLLLTGEDTSQNPSRWFNILSEDLLSYNAAIENRSLCMHALSEWILSSHE